MDILPRLVGAFYLVGGWLTLRAVLVDDVLDRMLAALRAGLPEPRDVVRRWVLGAGGVLTSLSGVALMAMSRWAMPLFVANLAVQAGWLVWARTAFPPEDAGEARGRRSVVNAAIGYAAVTLLVFWLDGRGRLASVADPLAPAALGATAIALGLWAMRHLRWDPGSVAEATDRPGAAEPPAWRAPTRVRLAPAIGDWCLWDADDGRGLHPDDYLPPALALRIGLWETAWYDALDADDPFTPPRFDSPESARAHAEEGRAIVAALEEIYGAGNVDAAMTAP